MLLMTVRSVFRCELQKGTGDDAELLRLRLRSSGSSVRETWEGGWWVQCGALGIGGIRRMAQPG